MARARRIAPRRRAASRARSGAANTRDIFARDWALRSKTLKRAALGSRDDLSADDVHRMRVTTRRLRASLSVLRHGDPGTRNHGVRRGLRELGRSLGAVRTLDVAIRDANARRIDTALLEKRRKKAATALRLALEPARIETLLSGLERAEERISRVSFERLLPWLESFEWELAYLIDVRPRTPRARHQLRVRMKKVRYVLEALGRRSPSIEKLQDALGKEHDLAVLQGLVGRVPNAARDEKRARARADRAMATALRAATRHLRAIRRDLKS